MAGTAQSLPDPERLLAAIVDIAVKAGRVALRDFQAGQKTTARIDWKEGGSPVTSADHAVDAFLAEALQTAAPFGYHSEERPTSWRGDALETAFVVDPIDGTRNFSEGGEAWCIVIGVISGCRPIAGAVHLPARQETWSAFLGGGAFLNGIRLNAQKAEQYPLRVTGPKPLFEKLGGHLAEPLHHATPVPALAHRLLVPLTGRVDLALANSGGHDWDIVASDCILREAGAELRTLHGNVPDYRLSGGSHPPLMAGSSALMQKIGAALLTDPV